MTNKAPRTGTVTPAYTKEVDGYVRVWGEGGGNAKESFELKLYAGDTLIATTKLNNIEGIIDGDVYVTWNFYYSNSNDAIGPPFGKKAIPIPSHNPLR